MEREKGERKKKGAAREKNARSFSFSTPSHSPRGPLSFPAAPSPSLFLVYFERCRRRLRFRRRMRFLRHCGFFFFFDGRRSRSSVVSSRFFSFASIDDARREREQSEKIESQAGRAPRLYSSCSSAQRQAHVAADTSRGRERKRKLSRAREREPAVGKQRLPAGDRSRRGSRRWEEQRELRRRASLLPLGFARF